MSQELEHGEERAILLRSEISGEADRRLALLCENQGLVWVTARGARRSRKRFTGLLEPFTQAIFRIQRSKRTLYLEGVDSPVRRDRIPSDLGRYYLACYACELVSRVLRVGQAAPEVYQLLRGLLVELQESPQVHHLAWRALFEAGLMEALGLFPALPPELVEGELACLEIHEGTWVAPSSAPLPGGLRVEVPITTWAHFLGLRDGGFVGCREFPWPVEEMRRVNRLTALLVRSHLQVKLHSASLLNGYQRQALEQEAEGELPQ